MKFMTAAEIRERAADLAPLESQKEYRHRLSEFIRMHSARVAALDNGASFSSLPGNSMLIIAQTGCGKSFTAARLAEAAGVDLITIDCSSLTRTGYKGCNLGDLLYSAKKAARDSSSFQRSILFFDEVDKLRMDGSDGNPQVNLLKLFDGIIQADPRGNSTVTLDVTGMSFLFAGAFAGVEDIIRRRMKPRSIGFQMDDAARSEDNADPLAQVTMADIRDYGFMDELLGRIGTLCYIPPLTVSDYRTLIKGTSGSVCRRYNNLLAPSGVTLDISDNACAYIAREAGKSALGARAVDPIIYEQMQSALSRLDEDRSINRVFLFCRNERLGLRYEHGPRTYPEKYDPDKKIPTPPDVSIAHYLQSEEGIQELLDISIEVIDRLNEYEAFRLKVFLCCCFRLMRTLTKEEDLVLSSVTKLADTTKPDGEDDSCFDRIVNGALKKLKGNEVDRKKLRDAYIDFCQLRSEENHQFWVESSRELRRKWYQSLIDAAACA